MFYNFELIGCFDKVVVVFIVVVRGDVVVVDNVFVVVVGDLV